MWKLLADVLDYHRTLISDRERCAAFRKAIFEVVRPGDVVMDIGTGTGLLALFACQAGARHVYAVEEGLIADVAELVLHQHGVDDRVSLLRGRSSRLDSSLRVDVIVSETLWNFGLGEGIMATLADARSRFLKPGGQLIPRAFTLQAAPVSAAALYERVAGWDAELPGIDLSGVRRLAANNVYRATLGPEMLLAPARVLGRVELGSPPRPLLGNACFRVERAGVVHGLGGWFAARLAPGNELSNAPPTRVPSWQHAFLPLDSPLAVAAGDELRVTVQCLLDESAWRWTVAKLSRNGRRGPAAVTDQTTLGGFPTALARLAPP
jgi:precorrin-6B methylase 2